MGDHNSNIDKKSTTHTATHHNDPPQLSVPSRSTPPAILPPSKISSFQNRAVSANRSASSSLSERQAAPSTSSSAPSPHSAFLNAHRSVPSPSPIQINLASPLKHGPPIANDQDSDDEFFFEVAQNIDVIPSSTSPRSADVHPSHSFPRPYLDDYHESSDFDPNDDDILLSDEF